jgi:hypothetical protein
MEARMMEINGNRMAMFVAAAVMAAGALCARAAEPVAVSGTPVSKIAVMEPAPAAEGAQADAAGAKDDLFAGTEVFEKGASNVNEVTMDPDSLELVGGPNKGKAHNMILNVVRSYEFDKPGMYNMADVDKIRARLNTGDWHCSIHTRDLKTGESSDICQKRRTDGLRETAIITVEPKELTFIHTIMRGSGPGSSELSGVPMVFSDGSLPAMAMLRSRDFARMQANLAGEMARLQSLQLPQIKLDLGTAAITSEATRKAMVRLDSPGVQQQLRNAEKQLERLNSSELKRQMERLNSPDGLKVLNDNGGKAAGDGQH